MAASNLPSTESKVMSKIVEVSGSCMVPVVTEVVYLNYCDESDLKNLELFSLEKERFFNDTMMRLKLPYRFKWILETVDKDDELRSVIASSSPPSSKWWEDNYCFINGLHKWCLSVILRCGQ